MQSVNRVGEWNFGDIPQNAPNWARLFTAIGLEMARQPNTAVGSRFPALVLSVPTGQYAAWCIAAGAFGAPPKLENIDEPGTYRCATWDDDRQQVGDATVEITHEIVDGTLTKVSRVGSTRYLKGLPLAPHRGEPPEDRSGFVNLTRHERQNISAVIRPMLPRGLPWYLWWTEQCVSPVVVVGEGSSYLMSQRAELLNTAPDWMWPTSRTLLSLDMPRLCNPLRALLFPFSIISPSVTNRMPWLRSTRPRIVIYTSWTAFTSRHPASFAGSPTVVLVNRRVESSLKCAEETAGIRRADISNLVSHSLRVRGIDLRMVDYPVVSDDGSVEETGEEFDDF